MRIWAAGVFAVGLSLSLGFFSAHLGIQEMHVNTDQKPQSSYFLGGHCQIPQKYSAADSDAHEVARLTQRSLASVEFERSLQSHHSMLALNIKYKPQGLLIDTAMTRWVAQIPPHTVVVQKFSSNHIWVTSKMVHTVKICPSLNEEVADFQKCHLSTRELIKPKESRLISLKLNDLPLYIKAGVSVTSWDILVGAHQKFYKLEELLKAPDLVTQSNSLQREIASSGQEHFTIEAYPLLFILEKIEYRSIDGKTQLTQVVAHRVVNSYLDIESEAVLKEDNFKIKVGKIPQFDVSYFSPISSGNIKETSDELNRKAAVALQKIMSSWELHTASVVPDVHASMQCLHKDWPLQSLTRCDH